MWDQTHKSTLKVQSALIPGSFRQMNGTEDHLVSAQTVKKLGGVRRLLYWKRSVQKEVDVQNNVYKPLR